jgi:F-type H+-transporting ATPase subunit a
MSIPIAAEPLFSIGAFPVTNAFINSTVLTVGFVLFSIFLRSNISKIPGRLQNAFEAALDFLLGYFDQVTGNRKKSIRFLPIVGTLFFFILLSNWMGLLPGTGTIGIWQNVHGEMELVPLFRPAGSDLNLTLAMALLSVISSHIIGMVSLGIFVHWNKFIQIGTLWNALKTFNPIKILTGFVEFIVGFIELFSEAAKVVSLSLRLFGNIFAGEVLITVISSLVSFVVPLPFMALELIVGIVQATVFSMLTLVYLTMMSSAPHGTHAETREETYAHS